jgi:hypothetical protein
VLSIRFISGQKPEPSIKKKNIWASRDSLDPLEGGGGRGNETEYLGTSAHGLVTVIGELLRLQCKKNWGTEGKCYIGLHLNIRFVCLNVSLRNCRNTRNFEHFIGAFAKLRKATISFVMSVRPLIQIIYPHGKTPLLLDGLLRNLIFRFF